MIHWAEDRDEDTWVNEGLSELAGLVNGYDVGSTELEFSLQPRHSVDHLARAGGLGPPLWRQLPLSGLLF